MASQSKAVGEEVQIGKAPAIETKHLSIETLQSTEVHLMTSTKLMLDATEKRKGPVDPCNSLMVAKDRDCIANTPPAQKQETTHVALTKRESVTLTMN